MRAIALLLLLGCARAAEQADAPADRCRLAVAHQVAGRVSEAEETYRDLAATGYLPAKIGLALLLRARGDIAEAKTCLEDALAVENAALRLAQVYAALGMHEECAVLVAQLVTDDPQTKATLIGALWNLGHDTQDWYWEVLAEMPPCDETRDDIISFLSVDRQRTLEDCGYAPRP